MVHDPEYVDFIKKYSSLPTEQFYSDGHRERYGLGTLDDPVFQECRASALIAGATEMAAEMVASGEVKIAFIWRRTYHASRRKAHGFCIFNDAALEIQRIRLKYPIFELLFGY